VSPGSYLGVLLAGFRCYARNMAANSSSDSPWFDTFTARFSRTRTIGLGSCGVYRLTDTYPMGVYWGGTTRAGKRSGDGWKAYIAWNTSASESVTPAIRRRHVPRKLTT